MREIKFRGLNTKGEWVYGDLIQTPPNKVDGGISTWIKPRTYLGLGAISTPTDAFISVDPETVGQLADLKDFEGSDIYEGDSLTCVDGDLWTVYFKDGSFLAGSQKEPLAYFVFLDDFEFKVVGNIHNNPKLEEGHKQ